MEPDHFGLRRLCKNILEEFADRIIALNSFPYPAHDMRLLYVVNGEGILRSPLWLLPPTKIVAHTH